MHLGQRVGLVGVNGAGKSTLLKILAGLEKVDGAVLEHSKGTTVGYLPQEIETYQSDCTIYDEAKKAFAPLLQKQKELDEINKKLSSPDIDSSSLALLLKKQEKLQLELQGSKIYKMDAEIHRVCTGLGFSSKGLSQKVNTLSGGWIMRLNLAKILLAQPDFVFLDEPTNHLDLPSLYWLEEFLKDFPSGMVIISHDKTFLDNITHLTWELSLGRLTVYKGNYSFYIKEKEKREELKRAAFKNQQAKIDQTMRFVERFRAKATKASQVKSKLKQLEKMDLIELEQSEQTVSFSLPDALPSGKVVLEVEKVGKRFENRDVFRDVSFMLMRGDKMAVVGVNGAGKSTLLKLLAGKLQPDRGEIKVGHNVKIAYFGQHQARELEPSLTVLETMMQLGLDMPEKEIRSILGTFLFQGDDVKKKVSVLSGGEKSRLALAKVMAIRANLLLLDEPTNHLDIPSQEAVKKALSEYQGSIVLVSHNRAFADGFINKVLEIKSGKATLYHGTVSDYWNNYGKILLEELEGLNQSSSAQSSSKKRINKKQLRKEASLLRQQKSKELAPVKQELQRIEKEIESLEGQKAMLEEAMSDPAFYKNGDEAAEQSRKYGKVTKALDKAYKDWEVVLEKIESINEKYAMSLDN